MRIRHFCYYLTNWSGITPRQEDWDSNKIVKCLKEKAIKGYIDLTVGGTNLHVDNNNRQEFLHRLWTAVGQSMAGALTEQTAIVPIPNSTGIVGSPAKLSSAA